MQIPDITNKHILVEVVDELKYRLKARLASSGPDPILVDFNNVLNSFIKEWELNKDQHSFAALKEKI